MIGDAGDGVSSEYSLTGRCVAKGCNGLELGIRLSHRRIYESNRKHVDTVDNAASCGYIRVSDGLVA